LGAFGFAGKARLGEIGKKVPGVLGPKIGGEPRNCHTQHLFFSDLPLVHARIILI
jgi:hypothetical protein